MDFHSFEVLGVTDTEQRPTLSAEMRRKRKEELHATGTGPRYDRVMKIELSTLILAGLCTAVASAATDPLSGLPLPPGFARTGDKTQSYTYCGKRAAADVYYSDGDDATPNDAAAWYAKALSGAHVFHAGGLTTFISPNGTAAVEVAGAALAFFSYKPGLSASDMKKLGAAPASRNCS